MCGRFVSGADEISWENYCRILRLPTSLPLVFGAEMFPSQMISVVRAVENSDKRELVSMKWGLVPSWSDGKKGGKYPINIRGETIYSKFREHFLNYRCVIPASGFFEWMSINRPDLKKKIAHLIHDSERPIFSMAGVWGPSKNDDGTDIDTVAIVTTEASEVVKPLHHRMPVILTDEGVEAWLDPSSSPEDLQKLLVPYSSDGFVADPQEEIPPDNQLSLL